MSDRIIKDAFLKHFSLEQPGEKTKVLPSNQEMNKLYTQAADLSGKSPSSLLPEEQRSQLSARRFPVMGEALRFCGQGLNANPDVAKKTGLSLEQCQQTTQLDEAAVLQIQHTGTVYERSAAQARSVHDEALSLGKQVLDKLMTKIENGTASRALVDTFIPAMQAYAAEKDRTQRAKDKTEAVKADSKAETKEAQERLTKAQTLANYLLSKK